MTVAVSWAKGKGAEAIICASTGNTAASTAAYAARAGMRGAVIVPGGQDRARQARPGGDARRARDLAARQLRPGAGAREADRRTPAGRAGQLDQPVPDRGPEDGGVRGLRRAGRGARRARHPGRQRGQRDGLVEGLRRVRAGPAAPVRLPGRGRRADRARPAGRAARDGRVGDPDRQPGALAGGGGRAGGVRRAHRGRQRRGDPRRAALAGVHRGRVLRARVGGLRRGRAEVAARSTRRCSCAC